MIYYIAQTMLTFAGTSSIVINVNSVDRNFSYCLSLDSKAEITP